ncbi:manganese efflux pump MntP family protein [Alkalihalobacterium sp. APHAB7]|uniref:manganese efflux pump MntP n=1 Tax=Alkalihalobacterium sp. APHAB7 TaxID=3402081 RepID=UPI003AACAE0A
MIWHILILVIASNLDDLAVGFSLGMRGKIPLKVIFTIAIFSGLTMGTGLYFGDIIAHVLPEHLLLYLASFVFLLIGLWFLWDARKSNQKETGEKKLDLSLKAAVVLGVALGIDSLAAGFSGGLAGFPIILSSVLAFVTSFLFIWGGSKFGHLVALNIFKNHASLISGWLFIILAIFIMLI